MKKLLITLTFLLICFCLPSMTNGAGVTIITHGFSLYKEDVTWLNNLGYAVGDNFGIPDQEYSHIGYVNIEGGLLTTNVTSSNLNNLSDNAFLGEIVIVLNWTDLATIMRSTTNIAGFFVDELINETDSRLLELPIHLIGHSRGGSLVCEISRLLGERGLWIDHVTTLDPHPVSASLDADPIIYENVLFADNYWQSYSNGHVDPDGEFVEGAYNRFIQQEILELGGYQGIGPTSHSDIHLWYYGTLDTRDNWMICDGDRKSTRLNSSHTDISRMPSSA